MQTLTIGTSVRPGRVAVLCDRNDPHWMHSCQHILDIFSTIWGGHGGIIVPTDGITIDALFWTILEAFDADYICVYRTTRREEELHSPERFEEAFAEVVSQWDPNFEPSEALLSETRERLRDATTSEFGLSAELVRELKARLAPFFIEDVLQVGYWQAGQFPGYPHTRLLDLLPETSHENRVLVPERSLDPMELLWYSAAMGSCGEATRAEFEQQGVQAVVVGGGTSPSNALEERRKLVSFVVDRASQENSRGIDFWNPTSSNVDTIRTTCADLSLLRLGWYKRMTGEDWAPKAIAVAGNSLSDFCLYLALSRMRARVFWIFPGVMEVAALGQPLRPDNALESTFALTLRRVAFYTQRFTPGLTLTSASLSTAEIDALQATLRMGADHGWDASFDDAGRLVPSIPSRFLDRGNAMRARVVQIPDSRIIELFESPKPSGFDTIHPETHRWITELEFHRAHPPRNTALAEWFVPGTNLNTTNVRTSSAGLAYDCPNAAILFGQDVDTLLVRPNIRIPNPTELFAQIATSTGMRCSTSDKGFYAEETLRKFGGLERAAELYRSSAGKALIGSFLKTERPKKGEYTEGVLINGRKYLCASDLLKVLGTEDIVVQFLDDFVQREILLRGFIFHCQYCRNSSWFRVAEVGDRFTCRRCFHDQIYTSRHWKHPVTQPSIYYQLDEMVYQGFFHNMHVPLLALDSLRQSSKESFLHVNEQAYAEAGSDGPAIECDLNCIIDGVLTLGEAKIVDKLDASRGKERVVIGQYRALARRLGARQMVFATMAPQWNEETVRQIESSFANEPIRLRFLGAHEMQPQHPSMDDESAGSIGLSDAE